MSRPAGESTGVYQTWPDGYEVRRMTPEDARKAEGWFCSYSTVSCDLEVALAAYPREEDGFYSGYLGGQMISSAIRIPMCEGIYYGSNYYVDEKHRLKGYGKRIRDEVASRRVGNGVLAIDAHDDMEEMNKRRGYKTCGKVLNFSGIPKLEKLPKPTKSVALCPVDTLGFDNLVAYDDKAFIRAQSPLRRALLEKWIQIPGGKCVAAIDSDNHVIGYGCRRPGLDKGTHMIGPLYADDFDVALHLFRELCVDVQTEDVSLSIHESHQGASRLMEASGLDPHLHMIRMYLNGALQDQNPRVFAVTSVEVCGF